MSAVESDDDWLSTGDAARVANVSRWKILRDAREGRLQPRKLPGTVKKAPENRFRRGDIKRVYGLAPGVDSHALRRDVDQLRADHDALIRRVEEHERDHP